jgi:hypothetical protein
MWLATTDNITFTWLDGHTYNIKDMKVYPIYDKYIKLKLRQNDQLDEIASRSEVFGTNTESYAYFIFECNIEKIVENDFDLNKLKEIRIPELT